MTNEIDLISRKDAIGIAGAHLKDVPEHVDLEADRNLFAAGYLAAAGSIKAALQRVSPASAAPVVDKPHKHRKWVYSEDVMEVLANAFDSMKGQTLPVSEVGYAVYRALLAVPEFAAAATAAPVEQSGILTQAISFCNHLAEHVTQELTEQSDNPQRDILNYEDYRKGQIQAAVEIRDRLQQLVSNANEGAR